MNCMDCSKELKHRNAVKVIIPNLDGPNEHKWQCIDCAEKDLKNMVDGQ